MLFERSLAALRDASAALAATRCYYVPGRLEVLGKHTDYAGGRSLVCAVERGICLAAAPRADARLRIRDARSGEEAVCSIDPDLRATLGHWANYPMTVARRLARNFSGGELRGADVAFASDLPPAAGLSSSSALITATFAVLADVNHLDRRPEYLANIHGGEDLAAYLGTVENGETFGALSGDAGVGTFGGGQDHTAILLSRPGKLRQYAFCPVRHERDLSFPDECVFVVGVSGVAADKTGNARERYNRASRMVGVMLEAWRRETGRTDRSLAAALASAPDALDRLRDVLRRSTGAEIPAEVLLARLEQFTAESDEIVPAVGDALARGDVAAIGPLAERSQALAERVLQNQVPETVALVRSARALGAVASSAFGAGFGGSVWALVQTETAVEFRARWAREYVVSFPQHAARCEFFATRPGPGLLRL